MLIPSSVIILTSAPLFIRKFAFMDGNKTNPFIYLGKSCDTVVLGEEKVKSIWYKDGEQFVIVHKDNDGLLQEDYRFYLDDKVAKLNCDKP